MALDSHLIMIKDTFNTTSAITSLMPVFVTQVCRSVQNFSQLMFTLLFKYYTLLYLVCQVNQSCITFIIQFVV